MIHNPKTGALVKTIHSHQADVLSLVCDETDVYAAGTDYRIQRLSQVNASNVSFTRLDPIILVFRRSWSGQRFSRSFCTKMMFDAW